MEFLNIDNLFVKKDDKQILNGVKLKIKKGEIHALIGPNGHGKSTLLNTIMGHPFFSVSKGDILVEEKSILCDSVDKRAKNGLFLIHQNPPEISGVNSIDLYRSIINSTLETQIKLFQLVKKVNNNVDEVGLKKELISRSLNEGYSGGEKKRNELLQLKLSNAKLALVDEVDSGLDSDGINTVVEIFKKLNDEGMSFVIVSHYIKLFENFKPDYVHIIVNGKIVKTGNYELLKKVEKLGYKWLEDELDLEIEKKEKQKRKTIGVCLNKELANANNK